MIWLHSGVLCIIQNYSIHKNDLSSFGKKKHFKYLIKIRLLERKAFLKIYDNKKDYTEPHFMTILIMTTTLEDQFLHWYGHICFTSNAIHVCLQIIDWIVLSRLLPANWFSYQCSCSLKEYKEHERRNSNPRPPDPGPCALSLDLGNLVIFFRVLPNFKESFFFLINLDVSCLYIMIYVTLKSATIHIFHVIALKLDLYDFLSSP